MRLLLAHGSYQQPGGEDAVLNAETQLLSEQGHQVIRYQRHNDELQVTGALAAASAGVATVWASRSYKELSELLDREKPDLAHFHNTFPLISPSAYYACRNHGVPVVQTLHNYRLLCPQAAFFRDGRACEDCLHKSVKWPAVKRACYRDSHLATAAVSAMLMVHRSLNTWNDKVNQYITLSEFSREKFIEGGLPSERIAVKPNFVLSDPGPRSGDGREAVYVGRLSAEKGPETLLRAWTKVNPSIPLRFVGDGPLLARLQAEAKKLGLGRVTFEGRIDGFRVPEMIKAARFLVFPSACYENFPVAIAEAYACCVPVLASRLGVMAEIVHDGVTGLLFDPNNPDELAAKVDWAWSHPGELGEMGNAARAEYEAKYTAEKNYEMLMAIYQKAMHGAC